MRLRCLREPAAGFSECNPIRSAIRDLHEVLDRANQPADRGIVIALGGAADLPEPQRLQGLVMLAARAVRGLHLGDHELRHQAGASSPSAASAISGTGLILSPSSSSGAAPSSPSTWRTVSPRSSATSWGLRRSRSAATVAFTRLIGFWLTRDFESTSWIPASSSTARTPPPAITPVPSEAGRRSTRPAP